MKLEMAPEEAMERIHVVLAHAWMVRTFLKHAPEFEDDPGRMAIPRAIFDFVRALEASWVERDTKRYLLLACRKHHRLKAAAEQLEAQLPEISNHTNFKEAAVSLRGCVQQIEEILGSLQERGPLQSHGQP